MDELKKNLATGKLVYGFKQTVKGLKKDNVKKVFLASNCPELMIDDVNYYSSINDIEIEKIDLDCDELGTLCKKPFMVSVVALTK